MFRIIKAKSRKLVKLLVERNPFTIRFAEYFLLHFPFLLPHDNDFYGFMCLEDKDKGLFLDVGANDGRSALSFHKLKKNWRIFSIEANPLHVPNLKRLHKKIPGYRYLIKVADRVSGRKTNLYVPVYLSCILHEAASTSLQFAKQGVQHEFSERISRRVKYIKKKAQTIKIDDLGLRPDIVKIDVEGHELDVLIGCQSTIEACRPIFLIEYNADSFVKILDFFQRCEYSPFFFDLESSKLVPYEEDIIRNCFFIPSEQHI